MTRPDEKSIEDLEKLQSDIETLQGELDQAVIALLVEIDRRVRRAAEDLQAVYHVFEWERIMAISEELEDANRTADRIAPKLDHAHDLRELTRLLKRLIPGSDPEFQKELHRFKIAALHYKNLILLGVLLELLGQLREVVRLENKFAI